MSVENRASAHEPGGVTISADNPWPGLLAFRETDEGYFQGRRSESEELFRLIMRERLTILFGLSGLGKSSLLQAGLFPRLRRELVFPVYIRLDFSTAQLDLVAQVFAAIAREAAAHGVEAPHAIEHETLWAYFHRAGHTFWNARNRPVLPLLVFDQFEEIFTLGRLDPSRTVATGGLIDQLADLAEGRPPAALKARIDAHPEEAEAFAFGRHHYKILLGIREDFLADLEALRSRMPAVALNRMRLRRMNGEAALLVVNQAPHLIDREVAEQVVRFVAAGRDDSTLADLEVEPALLSVVCRELNEKRKKLGEAKITEGLLEGNQEQVLTDFFERSTGDLQPEVRHFIEDHLLTVSGFRDSVAVENALSTPGVSREALDRLVERRMVRREDRGGVQRLELTHDLLAGVVRASRDRRRETEQAERARLALLQAQEQQQQALLKAREELDRQREKAERDKRDLRRVRIAAGVCFVLALAAGAAAIWAVLAQQQAERAAEEAENAKSAAVSSQEGMLRRLEVQLGTSNGDLVVSALDELSRVGKDAPALGNLGASLFQTPEWFSNVSFALNQLEAREPTRAAWARQMRQTLWTRFASESRIGSPPTAADDERLNPRIALEGGTFEMGSRPSVGIATERPSHRVTISPFRMQEHEVTNAEYRRFDPSHEPGARADSPVASVNWHQAMAYAAWLGGSLPTEAQWEFAARGEEGRTYPWGNEPPTPTCERAIYRDCNTVRPLPVTPRREAGRTPQGLYDLAGNVREWCRDWYGGFESEQKQDPLGPPSGDSRVVRGGSVAVEPFYLRGAARLFNAPSSTNTNLGFRVVWPATGPD